MHTKEWSGLSTQRYGQRDAKSEQPHMPLQTAMLDEQVNQNGHDHMQDDSTTTKT